MTMKPLQRVETMKGTDARSPESAGRCAIDNILLCCSRTEMDTVTRERFQALTGSLTDWQGLFEESFRHGIFPLLQHHLLGAGADTIPEPARGLFWDHMRSGARQRLLLTSELSRLSAAFDDAGIGMAVLKGAALARTAYGDPALREFYDLDLLVRPVDFGRASDLLAQRGYVASDDAPEPGQEHRHSGMHRSFIHPVLNTSVELHWTVTTPDLAPPGCVDRWWSEVRGIEVESRTVTTLSACHNLLMLCIHGARHDWARLRCLADLAECLRAEPPPDWDLVWAEADLAGCRLMLALGLILANQTLAAPVPLDQVHRAESVSPAATMARAVPLWLFPSGRPVSTVARELHRFRLRLRPRLRDRLEYGWRYIGFRRK